MIVATGLAMISFVFLGAVNNPQDLPAPLVVILLAAMIGGIFWLAGLSRGKGIDWGLLGVVIGVALGLAMIWSGREPVAVEMVGGNLNGSELSELMRERQVANNFVQMAATAGLPQGDSDAARQAQIEATQRIRRNRFGFYGQENVTQQDVVLGEILRREADDIGMVISDQVVLKFIADVSGGKLTKEAFSKIRRTLQVSETSLIDILRKEIRAREAGRLLIGQDLLTPQNQWEFYKKLSVSESAELVSIPVSEFVTDDMQPTDEELQNLLVQFNENMPGFTPEGRPEEGRPGFFQPPKMRIAYLEAVFDDIQETVGDVTDEEIQKRYENEYKREVPTDSPLDMKPKAGGTPPALPALPGKSGTPEPPAAPTKNSASNPESKPESKASPEKTEAPKVKEEKKPAAEPAKEKSEADKPSNPEAKKGAQSFKLDSLSRLQFVAFQEDKPKEEKPAAQPKENKGLPASAAKPDEKKEAKPAPAATEKKDVKKEEPAKEEKSPAETPKPSADKPAAEKPATEKPAAEKAETPAETKPEMKKDPAGGVDIPPAPTSDVPELDEELKATLREDILRERTQVKIEKLTNEAYQFVNDLSRKYRNGELDEDYLSLEEATKQIKAYAAKHHLEYIETPFLTLAELRDSEDYPIGSAFIAPLDPQRFRTVTDELAQSIPTIMFQVKRAHHFSSNSRYVFWKTGYHKAYAPKSIDDEKAVREQVTKIWKLQKAEPAAKQRAEQLAKMVRQSDKPMSEALTDETVTGSAESLFLTVRNTGQFTMMTRGRAVPNNPFQQTPPRYSVVAGAEDAGQRFFTKVFDEMDAGDVGVAPNRDNSVYYVVRIIDRSPGSEEELNQMRAQFLKQGPQREYSVMGGQLLSEYGGSLAQELNEKYKVQFLSSRSTTVDADEG